MRIIDTITLKLLLALFFVALTFDPLVAKGPETKSIETFYISNDSRSLVFKRKEGDYRYCEASSRAKKKYLGSYSYIYMRYNQNGRLFLGLGRRPEKGRAYYFQHSSLKFAFSDWRLMYAVYPPGRTGQPWREVPTRRVFFNSGHFGPHDKIPIFEMSSKSLDWVPDGETSWGLRVRAKGSAQEKLRDGKWASVGTPPKTMRRSWTSLLEPRFLASKLFECQKTL